MKEDNEKGEGREDRYVPSERIGVSGKELV